MFRAHIVEMEDQNRALKQEMEKLRSQVTGHSTEMGKMQRRVRSLEKSNEQLLHTNNMYEQERRDLEREVQWRCCRHHRIVQRHDQVFIRPVMPSGALPDHLASSKLNNSAERKLYLALCKSGLIEPFICRNICRPKKKTILKTKIMNFSFAT